MKLLFWLCLAIVIYTYFGYATLLWIQAKLRARPVLTIAIVPSVSIIISAHNEEVNLPAKIENLRLMDYPKEHLQIIVASDGSTDRTPHILHEYSSKVLPVILSEASGKAYALNAAVKQASGEILVFLDTRQYVALDAISQLVSCFADPEVGAVSGELLLNTNSNRGNTESLGVYWKIEKAVRKLESSSGSVVGVTGAIYAMRRELYTEMPRGTILDDVFLPMHVVRAGKRVVFQPSAVAYDHVSASTGKEFSRKVRTLTGNYQLIRLAPWLLSGKNPLLFRLISHKLLRLTIPIFLFLMLLSSSLATGSFYRAACWAQIAFYGAAIVGTLQPSANRFKPVSIAYTFVMLNTAATIAFYNFLAGRYKVWT
jgi:cellulose synthase/poly-beta-1,6-N-acetylglucosamine synthase-like glycosyltransferase